MADMPSVRDMMKPLGGWTGGADIVSKHVSIIFVVHGVFVLHSHILGVFLLTRQRNLIFS